MIHGDWRRLLTTTHLSSAHFKCQPQTPIISHAHRYEKITITSRIRLGGRQLTLYSLKCGLYAICRVPPSTVTRVLNPHVNSSGSGYLHNSPSRKRTRPYQRYHKARYAIETKLHCFLKSVFVLLVVENETGSIMPTYMLL